MCQSKIYLSIIELLFFFIFYQFKLIIILFKMLMYIMNTSILVIAVYILYLISINKAHRKILYLEYVNYFLTFTVAKQDLNLLTIE